MDVGSRKEAVVGDETETFGKYRVLEEIGRGGFATVYRAIDTTLGREVALKVLDPLLSRDVAWVERFRREARAVAALEHPHIVTIHEIAEAEGRLFLAMKLVRGPDLSGELRERERLPWDEALHVIRDVAVALDYAHSQHVLHRDLKPGNILLDPANGAVLTDFGFARLVGESSLSVSLSGGLVGTPEYIAPELWYGREAGPGSDLYALGCVLYETLLGYKAFHGPTPPAVMMAHFQPLVLPETWPEGVPPDVTDVLLRALAREPDARYASAGALLAALEGLVIDRLAAPYAQLEAALAEERWEAAQRLAEDIQAQNPTYREVTTLGEAAQAGWAQAERAAAAVQWREQTRNALSAGAWDVARAAAAQWLLLLPDDPEARQALAVLDRRGDASKAPTQAPASAAIVNVGTAAGRRRGEAEKSQQKANRSHTSGRPGWVWAAVLCVVWVAIAVWAVSPAQDRPAAVAPTITPSVLPATRTPAPSSPDGSPAGAALGDQRIRPADGMELVYVPAGSFRMGRETGTVDEKPAHTVTLDAFWLDRTEVTNAHYTQCVAAGECESTLSAGDADWNGATYPVIGVSWNYATAYCAWAGGRLPTEAEWEYAAGGPESRIYPWGDDQRQGYANCHEDDCRDGFETTSPVGTFPEGASWVGALDMAGNVWEWVNDWYSDSYYGISPTSNPPGPASGTYRVFRGSSFVDSLLNLRVANRDSDNPDVCSDGVGFRCVGGAPGN